MNVVFLYCALQSTWAATSQALTVSNMESSGFSRVFRTKQTCVSCLPLGICRRLNVNLLDHLLYPSEQQKQMFVAS
jgi:hypothetical protein